MPNRRGSGRCSNRVKKQMRCVAVMALLLALTLGAPAIAETVVLNDGWMFRLGDQPGAEQTDFDDHDWRRVVRFARDAGRAWLDRSSQQTPRWRTSAERDCEASRPISR